MKLCVSSGIIARRPDGAPIPLEEALRFLKEAGFEEIDYGCGAKKLLEADWRAAFEQHLRLCDAAGVRVRYAHLPFSYPAEDDEAGWQDFRLASGRAIELAALAGVDCAAIHPRTSMTRVYDHDEEHDRALAFLIPYRDLADKAGLTLALENMRGAGQSAPQAIHRYGTETGDLMRLAEELDVGVCWDTGHGNISGQNQLKSLKLIGGRLKMVHLNDNFAEDDVHIAPFLGNVRWQDVVDGLKAVNYQGSLNLEVNCNKLPEDMRAPYAAFMAAGARRLRDMMQA